MKTTLRLVAASLFALSAQPVMADEITDAIKADHRTADATVRDEYRNPQQTLRFFGIEPDMTVVEIWPGGGWYTDILTGVVGENGKLIAAHFHVDEDTRDYYKKSLENFKSKMKDGGVYSDVELTAFHPGKSMDIAEAGSADAVLTFRNVHNWYMNGGQEGVEQAFKTFYKALKPGGVLGVVDHKMPESADDAMMEKSGYVKQSFVVEAAEAAGFKLDAESDINANSMDNAQHPKGVWTLPPTLALGEEDQQKYLAIGESNRMTLKFVKPE